MSRPFAITAQQLPMNAVNGGLSLVRNLAAVVSPAVAAQPKATQPQVQVFGANAAAAPMATPQAAVSFHVSSSVVFVVGLFLVVVYLERGKL